MVKPRTERSGRSRPRRRRTPGPATRQIDDIVLLLGVAKDAGVSSDGTGSHRLMIGSDAGPFTDPDGFAWEAPSLRAGRCKWLSSRSGGVLRQERQDGRQGEVVTDEGVEVAAVREFDQRGGRYVGGGPPDRRKPGRRAR